jgi:hypothetical protein
VTRTISTVVLLAAAAFLALAPLEAQEKNPQPEPPPLYSLGDQTLAITGGLFVPLFFLSYQPVASGTNLTLGGVGSLQWQAYLASAWRIGVELGGVFAFSPNLNALLMLPITAKLTFVATFFPFEVPIFLGAGINIVKYSDQSTVDPLLKTGAGFYWIFNSSWSFGVNAVYWWDIQFAPTATQSRIGNFLELSVTALYHY